MPKGYRKCCVCGDSTPTEAAKIIGGKAYCPKCAKGRIKEAEVNKKLNEFLYNLCDKEQDLMPFLCTQVRRMCKDYEFKPSGILATLQYIFELSENPPMFVADYGIEGLVIRNYYKARKYYEQKRQLSLFPELEIDNILSMPEKEVHLNQEVISLKNEAHINKMKDLEYGPLIDLDSIEDEGEIDEEN